MYSFLMSSSRCPLVVELSFTRQLTHVTKGNACSFDQNRVFFYSEKSFLKAYSQTSCSVGRKTNLLSL